MWSWGGGEREAIGVVSAHVWLRCKRFPTFVLNSVLFCPVLFCFVSYCCFVLFRTVLHCSVLHCTCNILVLALIFSDVVLFCASCMQLRTRWGTVL